MTAQEAGLLIMQLVVSLGILVYLGTQLLQSHESKQKYRLFAVRDKLLYLVANGSLPETSMVFKVFYRAMNVYIAELESVTLVSFIRASLAAKTEIEKQNRERLRDALMRLSPEVHGVIDEFFHAVMDALRYNSPMLSLVLILAKHCSHLFCMIRKLRRFSVPVYDTYRYYENIHGTLGLA